MDAYLAVESEQAFWGLRCELCCPLAHVDSNGRAKAGHLSTMFSSYLFCCTCMDGKTSFLNPAG
jgi:hypothetical protein